MSWSKADAFINIPTILLTLLVFHEVISWLNTDAPLNIFDIFVTLDVLVPHAPMF